MMEGHVQSAAWSPCGTKAVFADSVQPTLYCVSVDRVPPLGEKHITTIRVSINNNNWIIKKQQLTHSLILLQNSSSKTATVIADFTENENQSLIEETR